MARAQQQPYPQSSTPSDNSGQLTAVAASVEVLALPEAFSLVEQANLTALAVSLTFPHLCDEVAILQRLAYKNNNQHRASKHYQAVNQVLRVFKLFQQLQLPSLLQHLHAAAQRTSMPEAAAATGGGSSKRARRQHTKQSAAATATAGLQRQAVLLPSFAAGCFVLRRLLSGGQLLLDLHGVLLSAGQHLSGQLSRGYFMPFCLVAAGAVARIRVLATTALLELLQAYNSVAQLLPLLPTASAEAGISNTTSAPASTTTSSRGSVIAGVGSERLPQLLQLAWDGPLPVLRAVPFDEQGPQSLAGMAAQLQQSLCMSTAAAGADGGGGDGAAAAGVDGSRGQQAALGDVGVAISREAFALQQQDANKQPRRQQQRNVPTLVTISVVEDKQPQPAGQSGSAGLEASAAVTQATSHQQQHQQQVPLYTTVPGLGFSLGQHYSNRGPTLPMLLGTIAAAAAAENAATHTAVLGDQQGAAVTGQQPAGGAAAGGGDGGVTAAMEADSVAAEDQAEYAALYGTQPTPPGQLEDHQQQHHHQQQQPQARRGLQASAGLLAMQAAHSSDDDDDVAQAASLPAAPVQQQQQQQQLPLLPQQSQAQHQQQLQAPASVDNWQAQPPAAIPLQPASQPAAVSQQPLAAQQPSPAGRVAAPDGGPDALEVPAVGSAAASASASSGGAPLLAKKGKQQKKKGKGKQQQQSQPPGEEAPRDSILDLLLQGL